VTGRVVLVALGAVGALLGLALAATGLLLLLLTGRDGAFGGSEATLSTPGYAVLTSAAGLGDGDLDGTVRVRVRSQGEVFVGVAPSGAVSRYLADVPVTELRDLRLSPLRFTTADSGGPAAPSAPDTQRWTVRDSGPGERTIEVAVGGGRQQTLVVMNADGSAGVDVRAAVTLRAAFLRRLAVGLLVAGAVVAVAGGVALAAGVRRSLATRSG
jgi:hypothetical protein